MLHRHTDVRFAVRDSSDQENRTQLFPKTPKNAGASAKVKDAFVTPAPRPRIALGAKSTNVHHRQFASAKTGKRHSPVAAPKLALAPVQQQQQQQQHAVQEELKGGAALRAALDRALLTGIDVPDVEYTPPKVVELPVAEPDNMEPMDWDAFREVNRQETLWRQRRWTVGTEEETVEPLDQVLGPFAFIETGTGKGQSQGHAPRRPAVSSRSKSHTHTVPTRDTAPSSSRLGRFAAPTASAQAKAKPRAAAAAAALGGGKENARPGVSSNRPQPPVSRPSALGLRSVSDFGRASSSATRPHRTKAGVASLERQPRSLSSSISSLAASTTDLPDPPLFKADEIPEPEPLPEMEVAFDIDDEEE